MKTLVWQGLCLFALLLCAAPTWGAAVCADGEPRLTEQAQVARHIHASEDAWAASVAKGDASVVRRILAADVVWVFDGRVLDKARAVDEASQGPGPFLSNTTDYVHVRFFGATTAVAQGSETWTKTGKRRGRFIWTDTWISRDGCWQIINAQDTVVPITTADAATARVAASPSVARAFQADDGAIADTLRGWYAARAHGAEAQSRARVRPDFYVFDGGKRFSGDASPALVKSHLDQGDKAARTITELQVHRDRGPALAIFTTRSSFAHAGKHQDAGFLESAGPKKADGRWRIAFFHSTQLPGRSPAVADNT